MTKINFEQVDFVKLIQAKSELNVKLFMFGHKRVLNNKLEGKNQFV